MAYTILDFIAAPFVFVANILLWFAAVITGKTYVLLEVTDQGEDDDN